MRATATIVLLFAAWPVPSCADDPEAAKDREAGQALYDVHCAACHDGALPEAQRRDALALYTPERIVESLNSGVMSIQGLPLSATEMEQVAYYLTGRRHSVQRPNLDRYRCASSPRHGDTGGNWPGWGGPDGSGRFQRDERAIDRHSVRNLELKWAFAFPDATRARSQPTVHDGVVYIGSQDGTVYALDANSGCIYWSFVAESEVRGAPQLTRVNGTGERLLVFGDFEARAYAVSADSGELRWRTGVHDHPLATITGSVASDGVRAFVPVSSSEVVPASSPDYPCCTFRGAVVAIDLAKGSVQWRTYTTPEPVPRPESSVGTRQFGPSGAPVWSGPTVDKQRGLLYVTTGQNYSSPATGTSDAVIAMDLTSGDVHWTTQVTRNDAWNGACSRRTPNCPEEDGPDFDLGVSAILTTTANDKSVLLIGQKSGLVYGLDPDDDGAMLWQRRAGRGGTMGGVHWGMSSDGERLYVGISDLPTRNRYASGNPQPGIHALDPATGEFVWRTVLKNTCPAGLSYYCFPGISAAVSSSPGLVFAGGLDGVLHAFDARSGEVLWRYDTRRDYETTNGVDGFGGAIEADGPVIANGHVYVTSGYDKWGEFPGNVLLAFGLPETASTDGHPTRLERNR